MENVHFIDRLPSIIWHMHVLKDVETRELANLCSVDKKTNAMVTRVLYGRLQALFFVKIKEDAWRTLFVMFHDDEDEVLDRIRGRNHVQYPKSRARAAHLRRMERIRSLGLQQGCYDALRLAVEHPSESPEGLNVRARVPSRERLEQVLHAISRRLAPPPSPPSTAANAE